jgi:hypothetical protein
MTKIIEIDLDRNIVIPINEPFSKEQLINTLAEYWEYDKGEEKTSRKEFNGTLEEFLKQFEGKKYCILENSPVGISYDITEQVPYELSKTEWVIQRYLKPSTDMAINVLADIQTKAQEKQIEELQEKIKAKKEGTIASLEVLRNIKLH